jgi:hypothetical protein
MVRYINYFITIIIMEQTLQKPNASGREGSWFSKLFSSKPPMEEKPAPKQEVCGVVFDIDTSKHRAKDPAHQDVLDLFDRWRGLTFGTFSNEREMAIYELFGITEVKDRVNEFSRDVCPSYGNGLRLSDYSGRVKGIMEHTASLHLNRAGIDHFGVPIFDFQLLRWIGELGPLNDIKSSILSAMRRREGRDSDRDSAYYIFQGMRMLRHLETVGAGGVEWQSLASTFPHVPVPGPLEDSTLAVTEKLEEKAYRTYRNKNSASR